MSDAPLRFESGEGSTVVELDPDGLASLAAGESAASPWTVAEGPDWKRCEQLRLLAAAFADGSAAAVVAIRPAGAEGHDADSLSAVLVDAGRNVGDVHDLLFSTERDDDGLVRRIGLEIWTSDEPPPRRLAADRNQTSTDDADGVERERVLMDARLDGESGTALLEILRAES
jgi:hypothetical protein